jgi:hypothetical protein
MFKVFATYLGTDAAGHARNHYVGGVQFATRAEALAHATALNNKSFNPYFYSVVDGRPAFNPFK